MAIIPFGYTTAFHKVLKPNYTVINYNSNPTWLGKLFRIKEKRETLSFDLIQAHRIYFFAFIPIFFKKGKYLYNKERKYYILLDNESVPKIWDSFVEVSSVK